MIFLRLGFCLFCLGVTVEALAQATDIRELLRGSSSPSSSFASPEPPEPQDIKGGQEELDPQVSQSAGIVVTDSGEVRPGLNIRPEVPSVRHIYMSPASAGFGGDDVEIIISPLFDVLIKMPDDIDYFRSSSQQIQVSKAPADPQIIQIKSANIKTPTPASLHLIDVTRNIYTFTVVASPADLSLQYPKTIIVNKRSRSNARIGPENPKSLRNAMIAEDAVQMVVGDVPNTNDYDLSFRYANYMHHEGYVMLAFALSRRNGGEIPRKPDGSYDLNFTLWANNRKIDGGSSMTTSRNVEWVVEPLLSKRATRMSRKETLYIYAQIKISILDFEDWQTAFVTVADSAGYTRKDFSPPKRGG